MKLWLAASNNTMLNAADGLSLMRALSLYESGTPRQRTIATELGILVAIISSHQLAGLDA